MGMYVFVDRIAYTFVLSFFLSVLFVMFRIVSWIVLIPEPKTIHESTRNITKRRAKVYLVSLVMNVHRLDPNPAWSSHARKVHTRAAEESSG